MACIYGQALPALWSAVTRYRTRPREVAATQWEEGSRHPMVSYTRYDGTGVIIRGYDTAYVELGDWIVTDATRNRIVKAADFAEQFEEISDE